jgi:hypothetical protein
MLSSLNEKAALTEYFRAERGLLKRAAPARRRELPCCPVAISVANWARRTRGDGSPLHSEAILSAWNVHDRLRAPAPDHWRAAVQALDQGEERWMGRGDRKRRDAEHNSLTRCWLQLQLEWPPRQRSHQ